MSVLRWTDEIHQAWKNKRAAQLAAERVDQRAKADSTPLTDGLGNLGPCDVGVDRAAASSSPPQRTSPDPAHSQGTPRGVASAARAPIYEIVHLCRAHRLPEPVPEYQFHPTRKWRFDYAWPLHMLALEVEGGIWTQGRHTRGAGALKDMEKYSEAAILGWRLLYVTPDQARGDAIEFIRRAIR